MHTAALNTIKNSRLHGVAARLEKSPGVWDISRGRKVKIYKSNERLFLLTSRDKERVMQARELLASRIGDNDVELAEDMLKFLSQTEHGEFANGTGRYSLTALYSKDGDILAAGNVVTWPEIGVVMNVLLAVDGAREKRGYGNLLCSEDIAVGVNALGKQDSFKYVFGELEPMPYFAAIVRMHGEENAFSLDMPYPLPPLQEGASVTSLAPTFFVAKDGLIAEVGGTKRMGAEEARGILFHIQEGFYGTAEYLQTAFSKFRDRIRDDSIRMRSLATDAQRKEVLDDIMRMQAVFNNLWPTGKQQSY